MVGAIHNGELESARVVHFQVKLAGFAVVLGFGSGSNVRLELVKSQGPTLDFKSATSSRKDTSEPRNTPTRGSLFVGGVVLSAVRSS